MDEEVLRHIFGTDQKLDQLRNELAARANDARAAKLAAAGASAAGAAGGAGGSFQGEGRRGAGGGSLSRVHGAGWLSKAALRARERVEEKARRRLGAGWGLVRAVGAAVEGEGVSSGDEEWQEGEGEEGDGEGAEGGEGVGEEEGIGTSKWEDVRRFVCANVEHWQAHARAAERYKEIPRALGW